jgi:tripartite-type tricarboxylate transporter receptor subunit TctC
MVRFAWIIALIPQADSPVVSRLNEEITKALNAPDVREKLHAGALFVMGGAPE